MAPSAIVWRDASRILISGTSRGGVRVTVNDAKGQFGEALVLADGAWQVAGSLDMDIAVNCVTPAAAKTRIFDQMSQKHIDYMLSKIPRGRFLQVEEAAQMITWLSTSENSFTTGSVFDLSGGRATY